MTPRSKLLFVNVGLFVLACLLLKDALFLGGAFYERDLLIYFPMAEAFVRSILEGVLPLRDPNIAFGQPILATPDAAVLYPPTWLHLGLLPDRAYTFFVLFHYVLGATGAAALAWRFSRSRLAGFFAGAFWLVSGPFQSFLTLWHHLSGAAWMPWVLTAFDRLLEKTDRRRVLILGGLFGIQILAGSADMCAMTLALAFLRLLCEARDTPRSRMAQQFGASLIALFVAICLGTGTWLTVQEISRTSLRASLPESTRTYWSVHPWLLSELVMPLGFGTVGVNQGNKDILFEGREPFVKSLFLGPLALPLLLGALVSPRVKAKYRLFAGIGTVGAMLLSLGRYTPVYDALVAVVPPLTIFRYPSKLAIPLSLLASILAGTGAAVLREKKERVVALIAAAFMLLAHLAVYWKTDEILRRLTDIASPSELALRASGLDRNLLVAMGALGILAFALTSVRPRWLAAAAGAGVIAGMLANLNLNLVISETVLRFRPPHASMVKTSEPSRVFAEDYVNFSENSEKFLGRSSPFLGMNLDTLPPKAAYVVGVWQTLVPPIGGAWGIEYAWEVDMRGLYSRTLQDSTVAMHRNQETPGFLRMLQVSNVSRLLALHSSSFAQLQLERTIDIPPLREPLYVFNVPNPLPRAYAVSGALVLDTKTAVEILRSPDFDPWREVILETGSPAPVSAAFHSDVHVLSRDSIHTAMDVTLNQPGSVVLVEGFLPGWHATLDGLPLPVHRANAFFVAVSAPAGRHTVVFTYRPWTAVVGVSMTVLTALFLLVALARRGVEA